MKKAADPRAVVADLRRKIGELKAERRRIAELPVPRDVAIQRINEHVSELAGQWRGEASIYSFPNGEFERPQLIGRGQGGGGLVRLDSVLHLIANLFPDALKAKLAAELDAEVYANAGPDGVAQAERNASIAGLTDQLFELEVAEESAITAAEDEGIYIARRPDADAAAVLAA